MPFETGIDKPPGASYGGPSNSIESVGEFLYYISAVYVDTGIDMEHLPPGGLSEADQKRVDEALVRHSKLWPQIKTEIYGSSSPKEDV